MKKKITSSVALCTYNGEQFLEAQLDSILMQTIPIQEIVVCDDGSMDKTIAILESYKKKCPDIFKIYYNEENLGYTKNFEKAISLCTQDIIFLSDQDDVWLPQKVEKIQNTFKKHPNINVVAHNIHLLKNNKVVEKSFWNNDGFNPNFSNFEILKYILFVGNVFPGMSMCINKKAKTQYLPFLQIHDKVIHDIDLLIKSLRENKMLLVNEVLAHYRIHKKQSIGFDFEGENNNEFNIQEKHYQYQKIKKICEKYHLDPQVISLFKKEYKKQYNDYLQNKSSLNRLFTYLKHKYYYKILDEIS